MAETWRTVSSAAITWARGPPRVDADVVAGPAVLTRFPVDSFTHRTIRTVYAKLWVREAAVG